MGLSSELCGRVRDIFRRKRGFPKIRGSILGSILGVPFISGK